MNAERLPVFTQITPALLRPRLARIGNIKIGGKGDKRTAAGGRVWYLPKKYDHFKITRRDRDTKTGNFVIDEAVHLVIGAEPRTIAVRLLFDEPVHNWQSSLVAYRNTTAICRGDGTDAFDSELGRKIPCTCPLLKQHAGEYHGPPRPVGQVVCKPNGVLSVLLEAAEWYGGFHVFRTTSWETISNITETLRMLRDQFGFLAFLPLQLVVYPATDTYIEGGQQKTSTSYKVTIGLRGNMETAFSLARAARESRDAALQLTSGDEMYSPAEHATELRTIARDDESDVGDEFYEARTGAGDDVEIESSETDNALEQLIRLAMEIRQVRPLKINQKIAEYSDRLAELATTIETEWPEAWTQAKAQMWEVENQASKESDAEQPDLGI